MNNISQEDKLPTRDSSSVSHINDLPDASLVVSSKIGSSTHVVDSISCGSIITTRAASTYVLLRESPVFTDTDSNLSTTKTGPMHAVSTDVVGPVSDPLDEKALIEERRKRREAIRAKYQAQPSPMLIQALHVNSEATTSRNTSGSPSTPMHGRGSFQDTLLDYMLTPSDQSEPSPPWTPNEISAPQSPVELIKDDDMFGNEDDEEVEPNQADHQEAPSAADYDPTADMEEERSRHIQQLQEADVSASTYDETQMNDKAPSLKSIADEENKDPRKNTFDMFAEDDDDDDMFAEAPKQGSRPRSASIKKTAQALDVNMMDNWDDTSGYYITIPGELIDGRYQVTQNLGRGMFASVIRVIDQQTSQEMAVKIVRNNDTMRKAGIKEVDILKDLATNDMDDKKHIVRLIRSFDHKGHLCMVFENLSMNLRELLKKYGRTKGIGMKAIRAYAQQLFLGLSLLKRCQYLHADLKPDNILVNENLSVLKICDLGSASAITEAVTAPYLVSRFYRAPELMLGMPYDYGIDVWSIGCTLFELYTGKILFTGKNNNGMLKAIMQCRGKFPQKILRKGTLTYQHFDEALSFQSIELDKLTGKEVTRVIDIKARPIRDLRSRLMPADGKLEETERKELDLLLDLLDKCLDLRVDKRLTPSDALKHPFILRTTSK